jgi:hypothetical protein
MSNLLEEAIVDAKALKEAALKSAQEAILEKYNPEVKKAIESLLLEQDEAAPGDIGTEEPLADPDLDSLGAPDAMGAGSTTMDGQVPMAATGGMNLCPCPDDKKVIEIDFSELQKAMMNAPELQVSKETLPPPMTPVEEPPMAPDVNANVAPEVPPVPPEEEEQPPLEEEIMDEEIEIDENLINSLLEDEELFQETEMQEELTGGQKDLDVAPPYGKLTKADFEQLRAQKDKKDLEEDARYQPSQSPIESIKDKKTAAEIARIAAELATQMVTQQLRENKKPAASKKQLNEAKVLAEKTSQLLEEHKNVQKQNKILLEENARLNKEHSEMMASALEFSKQLEKLNLQNARLYYKNQALSSASLNERQKTKIVEAISKADSVDEVKIIFETLQSTVGSTNTVKEPKSLSEAVTRNGGFNIRAREQQEPATNPAFDRWQRIAGIKK